MAGCKVYVMVLVACFIGIIYAAPVEEDDVSVSPEERQFIRRITRTRTVIPGIGYGGYGLGGLGGYGLGGGFFDEDQDVENDALQGQMMRFPHTLVIPGHRIRKLKIKLHKPSEFTDNMESTDNENLTSATDSVASQKLRVIRIPHKVFSRLSKYAKSTDMSNENTDNIFPDIDNTEEGNYLVDGVAGDNAELMKVLRAPHKISRKRGHMNRRLKGNLYKKYHSTDNMESTDNADLMSAIDSSTGQKNRLIRVPHNIFSRLSKYAKSTDTDTTDMSNENTDNNWTDMDNLITDVDNTEEGNYQVEGVAGSSAGLKVLRVPHNIFRKLAKLIPQRMRTAVTDQSLESLVDGKENTKIRVLNVPRSVYKKLKELHDSALDEGSHDESSE